MTGSRSSGLSATAFAMCDRSGHLPASNASVAQAAFSDRVFDATPRGSRTWALRIVASSPFEVMTVVNGGWAPMRVRCLAPMNALMRGPKFRASQSLNVSCEPMSACSLPIESKWPARSSRRSSSGCA